MKLYKKIILIALPIALENMMASLVNFIDIFMIGSIGKEAISSLGISNQVFFIFATSMFGILSGSNIISSQYFGNKQYSKLKKIVFINIVIALIIALPFFMASTLYGTNIALYYNKDVLLVNYVKDYLKIIAYTYPIFAISFSISMVLRSMNLPKYSFYASFLGLVINFILNLVLIPMFQVQGAAMATLIARIISLIYLIYILINRNIGLIPNINDIKSIEYKLVKSIIMISALTFIHEIFWSVAGTVKVKFYAQMGIDAFSSIQLVESISRVLFTLIIGISNATAIIIGNEIGNNKFENSYEYSKKCIKIFTASVITIILTLNILAPIVFYFMKIDSNTYKLLINLVYAQSGIVIVVAYSILFLVGILRAGGDIIYSMTVEVICMWAIGIPLTYMAVKSNLSIPLAYFISWLDELIVIIPCIIRYRSKKWIKRKI